MKKLLFLYLLMSVSALCFGTIEKYYVHDIEISKDDFAALDTTLLRSKSIFTEADTARIVVEPDIFAKVDSTSVPGRVSVVRRPDKEIAAITAFLNSHRTESALMKPGDTIPDFSLYNFRDPEVAPRSYKEFLHGKVVLLNFWATWCGPCLEELKPEHLPSLIEEFAGCDNFVFLPVSVNHTEDELTDFFNTPRGKALNWIENTAAWDKNGDISRTLSSGGIPLTVLIDQNGVIRLNEAGAFLSDSQKEKLRSALSSLLHL